MHASTSSAASQVVGSASVNGGSGALALHSAAATASPPGARCSGYTPTTPAVGSPRRTAMVWRSSATGAVDSRRTVTASAASTLATRSRRVCTRARPRYASVTGEAAAALGAAVATAAASRAASAAATASSAVATLTLTLTTSACASASCGRRNAAAGAKACASAKPGGERASRNCMSHTTRRAARRRRAATAYALSPSILPAVRTAAIAATASRHSSPSTSSKVAAGRDFSASCDRWTSVMAGSAARNAATASAATAERAARWRSTATPASFDRSDTLSTGRTGRTRPLNMWFCTSNSNGGPRRVVVAAVSGAPPSDAAALSSSLSASSPPSAAMGAAVVHDASSLLRHIQAARRAAQAAAAALPAAVTPDCGGSACGRAGAAVARAAAAAASSSGRQKGNRSAHIHSGAVGSSVARKARGKAGMLPVTYAGNRARSWCGAGGGVAGVDAAIVAPHVYAHVNGGPLRSTALRGCSAASRLRSCAASHPVPSVSSSSRASRR